MTTKTKTLNREIKKSLSKKFATKKGSREEREKREVLNSDIQREYRKGRDN